jgi:heterodisulfide reductase subunit B
MSKFNMDKIKSELDKANNEEKVSIYYEVRAAVVKSLNDEKSELRQKVDEIEKIVEEINGI